MGLITADEVAMAGEENNSRNNSYYLYTNENYWSGSPYDSDSSNAYGFYVNSAVFQVFARVNYKYGVRPVVSLSSKAKLSGNGTYSKPYTVS